MPELDVTSELAEAVRTELSSSGDTPTESLSMTPDIFAASELEPINKKAVSPMDDWLVAKDSEKLTLLTDSVLTGEKSLLDVRGVASEVTCVDAVSEVTSDGMTSDENMSSSPEPSNSVTPDTGVTPCQTTIFQLQFLFTFCAQHSWTQTCTQNTSLSESEDGLSSGL
jgi:hypothetical protein